MAELAALNVLINGDSSGLKAAITSSVGLVDKFKKSAEDSAKVFERAFSRTEKSVENLRRRLDPAYAATKRYESAVDLLGKALRQGSLTQDEHSRSVELARQKYLSAEGAADRYGRSMNRAGAVSGNLRGNMQNLGFQIQDIAVQLDAGTRASQVFAQQGSQIMGMWGPVGALMGAGLAITLPLVARAMGEGADSADSLTAAGKNLNEVLTQFTEVADVAKADLDDLKQKYGENAEAVRDLARARVELQQVEAFSAMGAAREEVAESVSFLQKQLDLIDTYRENLEELGRMREQGLGSAEQELQVQENLAFALDEIQDRLGLTEGKARELAAAFQNLSRADGPEAAAEASRQLSVAINEAYRGATNIPPAMAAVEAAAANVFNVFSQIKAKSDEVTGSINFSTEALRNLLGMAAGDSWLDGMISSAQRLAGVLWNAAQARSALAGVYSGRGSAMTEWRTRQADGQGGTVDDLGGGGGSGGGGGGGGSTVNPLEAELEALQQALMTAEELELASWEKRQETLRMALEQRLLTQQEYAALMEDAQRQHNDKMASIDAYRYGDGLQKTSAYLGDMAKIMAAGNEKMVRISKVFAAAEAFISTMRGAAKELEKGTFGFASAAAVIAKGMGFISAINGVSTSGGGGGGGGYSSATAAAGAGAANQAGTYYNVTLAGEGSVPRGAVRGLIEMINDEVRNGAVLRGIRVT